MIMPHARHRGGHAAGFLPVQRSHAFIARIRGDVMGRVRQILLAGTGLATSTPPASLTLASGDPAMSLAQAGPTPEQEKDKEQDQKKKPPGPPQPPAAQQPRPPAPAQPPAVQAPKPSEPAQIPPPGPP